MNHASSPPRIDATARLAVGLMTVLLAVMVVRVAQLQLAPSQRLARHIQARIAKRTIPAPRGDIVDRRYRPLGSTQFGYRVFVDPTEFPSPPDEAIARLTDALDEAADDFGGKILRAVQTNRERAARTLPQGSPAKPGLGDILERFRSLAGIQHEEPAVDPEENAGEDPDGESSLKPIRYVRISGIVGDDKIEKVKSLKIAGVHLEKRSIRDYPTGGLAASIIGKVNVDHVGVIGAERTHDADLAGTNGRILYVQDARGRPLWMGPGAYDPARRGDDLRLSIDLEMQRIVTEELERGVDECDAAAGRAVMIDPATGEILAMVDLMRPVADVAPFPWPDAPAKGAHAGPVEAIPRARYLIIKPDETRLRTPALARNRCVEDIYEPGSTFKPFVWASITELGLLKPQQVLQTHNGFWVTPYGRPLHDVHRHEQLTWENVLIESSNIGMAQGAEQMTFDQMSGAIRRFGFGACTNIGLPGETAGVVTPRKQWSKYTQTSVSFGQEVAVTPVQMVRAFSAFARSGEMAGTLPPVRLAAVNADEPDASIIHRVLKRSTVMEVRRLLAVVAAEMEQKMATHAEHPETGWRYAIFGKSGTAQVPLGKAPAGKRRPPGMGFYEKQYRTSFIAAGPTEDPRLVVLVVIEDPGPELVNHRVYYGSHTAGPVVRRIMERSLSYLGVSPSPESVKVKVTTSGSLSD